MKFAAIILLVSLNTLSATTFGQRFTLKESNVKLTSVLRKIEQQIPYQFMYDKADTDRITVKKVNLQSVDLDAGLDLLLRDNGLEYKRFDDHIVIKRTAAAIESSSARQSIVTGVIRDLDGQPIADVTITVKERPGTRTNSNTEGEYRITVPAGDATLLFDHISYQPREIQVQGNTVVNVTMDPQRESIDDVVVVGYGTQRRINVTGSVGTVRAEDFEARPVTNLNQALQGQMPGVTVVNSNGRPGTNNTSIRVRGVNTLNSASPLVVIDGVPGGDMSILNPEDVESVSVLKDAASASIYGVRGGNGVILVTTKRGRSAEDGKADIKYNGYYGLQKATALPKMASSVDYMLLMNEALVNARNNPAWTDEQIQIARDGSDPNYYANTNWIEDIYENHAPQQAHNLSVNGGMGKSAYYLAYGYLNQGGMITGDNYNSDRHNVRGRFTTTLFDRLELDGTVGYVDRDYIASAENPTNTGGPLSAAMSISPLVPVRFTTGGWGYHGGQRNPIAVTTAGGTDRFNSQEFTGNMQATLHIWDGLRLRGQFGNVRYHTRRSIYQQTIDYIDPYGTLVYQTNVPNRLQVRSFTQNYKTLLGMLEYEKTFADAHYVKGMVAASQEENVNNDINASRTHFPVDGVPSLNVGTENQLNSNPADQWALRSVFGRINYAYKDRYLFETNFRRDGSSRFDPSLRWNWFGSVSGGWVFSEESFFSGLKDVINMGKVRFSWGTQGNDRVVNSEGAPLNFAYMGTYESRNSMPIGNVLTLGFWQPQGVNPLITWEKTEKRDIGLDFAMLNNRLNITAEYYQNTTDAILLAVPLPGVYGASAPPQNAGAVENRGWETQVGWRSRVNEVRYGVTANFADVRNTVTNYGGAPPVIADRIRRVGDPIDAFYGLVADRIAQEADFDYNPTTGAYIPRFPHIDGDPLGPGDMIYKVLTPTTDIDKPYDINDPDREYISLDKDRQVIGNAIPRYTYGFRGDIAWKGIDFSFFLQGVGKINGLLTGQARHALINESSMPQESHLDRWTPDNPDGSYPRLVYNQSFNTRLSTFWLQDASYLRLKNVQVGYTLPAEFANRYHMGRVRLYVSADNLFTQTNFYSAFDPEVPVTSGGVYPQMKTFVFGISATLK